MGFLKESEYGLGKTPEIKETRFQFSVALDDPRTPIDVSLLGNKGAGLVEMTRLDLPVPPGFILTTKAWCVFNQEGHLPRNVWQETLKQFALLEKKTDFPLIVSVRSGAPHSMPGLLSTISNVGLNDKTVWELAKREGEWCAWDSYRLGIESFATGITRIRREILESVMASLREKNHVLTNQGLPTEALMEAVKTYKKLVNFPQDPKIQLRFALESVFRSWNHPVASAYRKAVNIPDDEGTAVTIEEMVFGNKPDGISGSGVYFTRDPQNGKGPKAAYLPGVQGEKVVGPESSHKLISAKDLPKIFRSDLIEIGQELEKHYGHRPQEIEFVYSDEGKELWTLQTRNARLSPKATLRTLHDLTHSKRITPKETIDRFTQELSDVLPSVGLEPGEVRKAKRNGRFLGRGIPISSGIARGVVVDNLDEAREIAFRDTPIVLVLEKLTKDDLVNLPPNVRGITTRLGGAGSHVAQILRGTKGPLNLPAIFGFEIDKIKPGAETTLDATTGEVFTGILPLAQELSFSPTLDAFLEEYRQLLQNNPWLAASYPLEGKYHWDTLTQEAETVAKGLKEWQSTKAQTTGIIVKLIPPEDRMEYLIFPQDDKEGIRTALYQILLDGEYEPSVRSCHKPPKLGQAPWQRITRSEEIDPFLNDEGFPGKYGGYPKWQEDGTLTEILVGRIPKGKLDPELSGQHCVFTVSCMERQVIVQVVPHTAQLRDLEQANPNKIITVTVAIDPRSPTRLGQITTQLGQDIEDEPESQRFANLVSQTVFEKWWKTPFALPHRLAALTQVANLTTLEGQARISPEGNSWCLVYGMKGREEPRNSI